MAHSIPVGTLNRPTPAVTAGLTPATWKTPYELYDERRSASDWTGCGSSPSTSTTPPSPASVADIVHVRGIALAGWRIESHKGSIADSKSIEERSDAWGIPLPEMPFDKNRLVLRYVGEHGSSAKWEYCLDGMTALRGVEGVHKDAALPGVSFESGGEGSTKAARPAGLGQRPAKPSKRVQVSYAGEWGRKRDQQMKAASQPTSLPTNTHFGPEVAIAAASGKIATARDFDWTYTSTWPGQLQALDAGSEFKPGTDPTHDRIPIERLAPPSTPGAKAEPILFFDDVILYEDELGDNGTSLLSVKVRVMPTGFLVLQRFFLRVDNVLFRIFDTRIYVSFYDEDGSASIDTPISQLSNLSLGPTRAHASTAKPTLASPMRVIRECCGYQQKYSAVRARLPPYKPNDLSPLTDPGWVAQQLMKMAEEGKSRTAAAGDYYPGTTVSTQHGDPTLPAVVPSRFAPGHESNRILGELSGETEATDDDRWECEGGRVEVAAV